VFCENLATHTTPAINDGPARHPRFHKHVTPTGSSWINQVERDSAASPTNFYAEASTHPCKHWSKTSETGSRTAVNAWVDVGVDVPVWC
jgi:hypothetical protein